MKEKFRVVEVNGAKYQVGRLSPAAGSYVLMLVLGAGFKRVADMPDTPASSVPEQSKNFNPEDAVRSVVFGAWLGGLDFEAHKLVQGLCLEVCSKMEADQPIPIMNGKLGWAYSEIKDDIPLVMKLEMEVLVFNLSDFFQQGGLNALAGKPPSRE